ncbi:MAG: HAD family hydrolase [Muribaculaceae bacterium]|nr:HAD family hydrolase [Muribaculaceae bacterium]
MKKLIIFDLDGTLLDTIADLGTACNYALEKMGYHKHPLAAYPYMVGNGVRKLMERAQPDASPEEIDELLAHFREYYDQHCTDLTKPYPGIQELLRHLTENKIAIAVATNKYESAAKKIIDHFFPDVPFVAVMGQVEDRPVKPDPSIDFAVLLAHPTQKSEAMHVGDSAVDIETARRACIDSVGVTWGFRPITELRKANADHIVCSPADILKLAFKDD